MESVASMDEADRNAMGDAVRLHPYSIDSAGLAQHCAVGGRVRGRSARGEGP